MENIFHRVSIRKYEDKPVEKEKILQILKTFTRYPIPIFSFSDTTYIPGTAPAAGSKKTVLPARYQTASHRLCGS